jgi:hypothetical protein
MESGPVLFVFTLYMAFLAALRGMSRRWARGLAELIKSPTIVAIFAGVLLA